MAKKSRQERAADWLLAHGAVEIKPSASSKYRQFQTPNGIILWLGHQGAIRKGHNVSRSYSVTDRAWERIIRWEDAGCIPPGRKEEEVDNFRA